MILLHMFVQGKLESSSSWAPSSGRHGRDKTHPAAILRFYLFLKCLVFPFLLASWPEQLEGCPRIL